MQIFGLPGKCHKMRKNLRKTFVFGFIEASSAKAGILRHLSAILGHFGPSIAQDGPTIVQYKPRWLKMAQAGPSKTTASGSMALLCHILLTSLAIIIFAFRSIAGQVRTNCHQNLAKTQGKMKVWGYSGVC